MSARIVANNFADLRIQLKGATAEQLKATEAYWAALPGVIAATHRHLIDEEIEVRQAVARLNARAVARELDVIFGLAPTTRWGTQR